MLSNSGAGEDSWESLEQQGDQASQSWYSSEGLMLKLKLQYLGHLNRRADLLEKPWCLEKLRGRGARNKMVGLYQWLNEHEFEQTQGDSDGQRSLVCCSSWGCRVGQDLVTQQQQAEELAGCISMPFTLLLLFVISFWTVKDISRQHGP